MASNGKLAAPRRVHLFVLCLLYLAIAVYGSWVPLNYAPRSLSDAWQAFIRIRFLDLGVDSRADWVANLLLFIPFGFLLSGICLIDRKVKLGWQVCVLLLSAVVGLLCSTAIEFSQLWFPNRTVSQNDIFAETTGAIVGSLLWMFCGSFCVRCTRAISQSVEPGQRVDGVLWALVGFHLLQSVLPLDLTIHPSEIWRKLRHGHLILTPFSKLDFARPELIYELVFMMLNSGLMGWLVARLYARRFGSRPAWYWLFLAGVLVTTAIEVMQLFVYSRVSDVDGILFGTAGFLAGGLALPVREQDTVGRRSRLQFSFLLLATVLYSAALVWFFWYPLNFDFDMAEVARRGRDFLRVPFALLQAGTYYNAMSEVVRKVWTFAMLTALIAVTLGLAQTDVAQQRSRILAISLALACGLGVIIEVGQLALPGRYADITDVLLYTTGSTVGMLLAAFVVRPTTSPAKASLR